MEDSGGGRAQKIHTYYGIDTGRRGKLSHPPAKYKKPRCAASRQNTSPKPYPHT
jgi:hypothetical protein